MQTELEFVREQLALRTRDEWFEVSEGSGVPFSTLKKIGYGQTPTPRSDTVGLLFRWLLKHRRHAKKPKRANGAVVAT